MTAPVASPITPTPSATGSLPLPPVGEGREEGGLSLTEHFATIASAPNGIKKLRELILELAVRGKLVPQDANEEPASVLVNRIKETKAILAGEGRARKKTSYQDLGFDERPFCLPAGWEWARLGDLLTKIGAGSTPLGGKQAYVTSGVKFLRSQNVWNEGMRLDDVAFIPADTHRKMSGTHVQAGDLLFNITGASIGRCAIVPDDFDEGNVSQHVVIIRPAISSIKKYLHSALVSEMVQKTVMDVQVGVSREGLSIGKLSQFMIPLPPEGEQRRIVERVDELMALCDQLEAQQADAEAAHEKLVRELLATLTQSQSAADFQSNWQRLATHFDTLFTTEASIDNLKQALLQVSVRGMLVPQRPNNEPGSALLRSISESKARTHSENFRSKQKVLDRISDEEMPFALPDSWVWARCEWICEVIVDCPHSTPKFQADGLLCLDTNSFKQGLLIERRFRFVSSEIFEERNRRLVPNAGDVVFAREGSVGESVVIPSGIRCCLGQRVMLFRPLGVLSEYFRLAISEPGSLSRLLSLHKGIGARHVNVADMRAALIPLPPLEEQQRILAKLDELMALADVLKAKIGQVNKVSESLASILANQAQA